MAKNIKASWELTKEKALVVTGNLIEKGKQVKESEAASKVAEVAKKSAGAIKNGVSVGARTVAGGVKDISGKISENAKKVQVSTLQYIDKKKNARFLEAKLSAFEDGMKAGKCEVAEAVKKYTNYYLAATAVSYFFARCDGSISEEELLEIQFDLDSIIKNKDLPIELNNRLAQISNDNSLSFDDVKKYLDGVSIDTVREFKKDIEEIICADNIISEEEQRAKKQFDEYLVTRVEAVE